MINIKTLQEENEQLKKKLEIAHTWMSREIKEEINKISKSKIFHSTLKERTCFLNDNIENIVTDKIQDFFGEIMLVNIPSKIIRNIISAEINYYNFRNNPNFDGFSVISSYHKSLDIIIETYIIYDFRKFIDKSRLPRNIENDSLEKSLKSVILNNYNLSVGRLYHLVQTINKEDNLKHYTYLFKKFIEKHSYIKSILLEDSNFFDIFEKLINSEVLGSKRHSGQISFIETREARKLLIGDFKDKNCLIYKLIMIGKI